MYAGAVTAVCAAALLACTAGCSREEEQPQAEPSRPASTARAEQPEPVRVETVDLEGLRAIVQEHAGDVVLVDFWATWCAPCVEAFPKVMRWQEDYGPRGFRVISVSVDFADAHETVVEFLTERHPPFAAYRLQVENFDEFVRDFAPEWGGGVPAAVVFDRSGERRRVFQGASATEDAEALVESLLDEEPPTVTR